MSGLAARMPRMSDEKSVVVGGEFWSYTDLMPAFFASSRAPFARVCAKSLSAASTARVFEPSFCPLLKKPSDQLEASFQGELLNHMSCCTFAFTWNEKLPMRSSPRCFTIGMIGAVGTVP